MKLEELIAKLQELVPEIMELKFGCRINIKYNDEKTFVVTREPIKEKFHFKTEWGYIDNESSVEEIDEILGRPITLEDCLKAMQPRDTGWYAVNMDGWFYERGDDGRYEGVDARWNLGSPLHLQSQETIDWLHEILVRNKNMNIQSVINGALASAREERLKNSTQLLLGELKLKLESVKDKSKPIEFDFGMKPAGASSWRGSYQELGLEYSENGGGTAKWNSDRVNWVSKDGKYKTYQDDIFTLPENPSTTSFLSMLSALTDKEMVGYKGGDFTMHKNVAVYLGNYGRSEVGDYFGEEYATVAPVDILEENDRVVIVTASVEY